MWFIVLVGAFMNVMVIWMFDLKPSTHAVIGGTISMFVGLVIYMIAVLDRAVQWQQRAEATSDRRGSQSGRDVRLRRCVENSAPKRMRAA